MVESHPAALASSAGRQRFIYICGCDGTGKTTQAKILLAKVKRQGAKTRHLWLRFPFLFSVPLLAYARLAGWSWFEQTEGTRHGYWNFARSLILRRVFPWVLLLDAAVAAVRRVYIPLWLGHSVICERFVLDMLVDLAVACDQRQIHKRLPGTLFLRLIPRRSTVIVLDLDAKSIRARRPDLEYDRRLEERLLLFRQLAADLGLPVVSSSAAVDEVSTAIWRWSTDGSDA